MKHLPLYMQSVDHIHRIFYDGDEEDRACSHFEITYVGSWTSKPDPTGENEVVVKICTITPAETQRAVAGIPAADGSMNHMVKVTRDWDPAFEELVSLASLDPDVEPEVVTETVTFSIVKSASDFAAAKGVKASLHEALCQGLHELDADALSWLTENVVSVDS